MEGRTCSIGNHGFSISCFWNTVCEHRSRLLYNTGFDLTADFCINKNGNCKNGGKTFGSHSLSQFKQGLILSKFPYKCTIPTDIRLNRWRERWIKSVYFISLHAKQTLSNLLTTFIILVSHVLNTIPFWCLFSPIAIILFSPIAIIAFWFYLH